MISAAYFPSQNFSMTCSGNMPLASWQFDLSSLSPGLSSADAVVDRDKKHAAMSNASVHFIRRNHCINCPPLYCNCPTDQNLRLDVVFGGARHAYSPFTIWRPPV